MTHFVYTIESPSPNDFLNGFTEGRALSEMLDIGRIAYSYHTATNIHCLKTALYGKLAEAIKKHNKHPILHLSLHGDANGVGLTDDYRISWAELRQLLLPLFRIWPNGLMVCMSSCYGARGCRMAMHTDHEPTFYALVGTDIKIDVADAALSYSVFYNLLFKGLPLEQCLYAMQKATANEHFHFYGGEQTKAQFVDYVAEVTIAEWLASLTQLTNNTGP